MAEALDKQHCRSLSKDDPALDQAAAEALLKQLHADWQINWDGPYIQREYPFKNYYETIAFVNALAWIANQQDHHPDLTVSYNRCVVQFSTHVIGGLSENDFICAAKTDALVVDGD